MMKRYSLALSLVAAWAFAGSPALAQVSQKISQMPAASALGGSELLAGVQAGANVSITPAQLQTYLQAFFLQPANNLSDVSSPSTALTNLGGQPSMMPPDISSNWYAPPFVTGAAGAALTAGTISCSLQFNFAPMTVKALGARITTAGSSNIQLADYANASGRPSGAPLGATGNIVDTAAGAVSAAPVGGNFTLPAGAYWACVNAGDSTVVMQASSNAAPVASVFVGSASEGNVSGGATNLSFRLTMSETFGTWPTATGSGWTEVANTNAAAIILHQSN